MSGDVSRTPGAERPGDTRPDPLEALCDSQCPHTRHMTMCAPCAVAAARPGVEALRDELERSESERERLRRRADHLQERYTELQDYELGIKSLTAADGSIDMDLHMAHEMMRVFVAAFVEILDKEGGPNYVELTYKLAGSLDRYTVTIRRPNGKSPHEARQIAEQRADKAEAERDALRDVIAERETEVDGLAERVAALRAELDRAHAMAAQYADRAITNGKRADKAEAERDRLAEQVAAVRAVHPRRDDPSGPVCGRCLDAYEEPVDWPCPTIRALDGPAGGERP